MLIEQNHYLFLCNENLKVGVSAPTMMMARERLDGYETVKYLGENSRLESYTYQPRSRDWLTAKRECPTNKKPTTFSPQRPAKQTAKTVNSNVTRTEELMRDRGLDRATASLLASMEKSNKA